MLTGIFQIIKGLLPKKVLDRLKFINSKNASQYISQDCMPLEWGGLDEYELKFESEIDETSNDVTGNNNDLSQVNLNLAEVKKVKNIRHVWFIKDICELGELHGKALSE